MTSSQANRLLNESSPYLKQHAFNPVDWYPWGEEALTKARIEDKPIILSIGYSACHWCHVMERESFEDQQIADIMNRYFVSIKLDREERPDIDQIYMDAIQAMGVPGGWPLNMFLTPEQEPFYGGTYFPPPRWRQVLESVASAYQNHREQLQSSAKKFRQALTVSAVEKYGLSEKSKAPTNDLLKKASTKIKEHFDRQEGGTRKAPKFPMPVIWNFLLHAHSTSPDEENLQQVYLTLDKMALGGIYDHLGGGFARYSVDAKWFAPHFEKMLYDNAQLISLYSLAYASSQKPLYKKIVFESIEFLNRELKDSGGAFYAALDADSEGQEGKFYTWTYNEFAELVNPEADYLLNYFGVLPEGNWEEGRNILHQSLDDEAFVSKYGLDLTWMQNTNLLYRDKLLEARKKRVAPGLDDKILCGWNGLVIKALIDAYAVFGESKFLGMALNCGEYLESTLRVGDQLLRLHSDSDQKTTGYLEDYATVIQGYLGIYQTTFEEKWLYRAQNLTRYTLDNFWDDREDLFFYTDKSSQSLIARKKEIFDNVIPASNSIMAQNLVLLGTILDMPKYLNTAHKMVAKVTPLMESDPLYLSNWGIAINYLTSPLAEVVISGESAEGLRKVLAAHFHPNRVIMGSKEPSTLPLLADKTPERDAKIYICFDKTCKLPTSDPQEAIAQLATSVNE